jgi:hypothetical protein
MLQLLLDEQLAMINVLLDKAPMRQSTMVPAKYQQSPFLPLLQYKGLEGLG